MAASSVPTTTTATSSTTSGVRQRASAHSSHHPNPANPNKLDVDYGNTDDGNKPNSKRTNSNHHHTKLRTNAIYWLPLFVVLALLAPELLRIPYALFIWASRGFALEHLLGAGIRPMVDNWLVHPEALIAWPYMEHWKEHPTSLAAHKDVILQEYEAYRRAHELPVIADLDPIEQGPLDTKGEWKTLFLRAMTRPTCAAPHFPKTIQAVDNSGFTAYSIMISRLGPRQKIEPHTGFSKIIQVYHLALQVPQAEHGPWLQVQDCEDYIDNFDQHMAAHTCNRVETYAWHEGDEFVFDDSNPHWVENPTDEERLVLFLHIARIDFKGWRERLLARMACWVFSWVPFPSVLVLVEGTKKTCAADHGTVMKEEE